MADSPKELERPKGDTTKLVVPLAGFAKFCGANVIQSMIEQNIRVIEGESGSGPDQDSERKEEKKEGLEGIDQPEGIEKTGKVKSIGGDKSPSGKKRKTHGVFYNNIEKRTEEYFERLKSGLKDEISDLDEIIHSQTHESSFETKLAESIGNVRLVNLVNASKGSILSSIGTILGKIPSVSNIGVDPKNKPSLELLLSINLFFHHLSPASASTMVSRFITVDPASGTVLNDVVKQINEANQRKRLTFNKAWKIEPYAFESSKEYRNIHRTKLDNIHPKDLIKKSPAISWLSYIFNTMMDETFSFIGGGSSSAQKEMDERNAYNEEYDKLKKIHDGYVAEYKKAVENDESSAAEEWEDKILGIRAQIKNLNDNYNPGRHGFSEKVMEESIREVKKKQNITNFAVKLLKKKEKILDELADIEDKIAELENKRNDVINDSSKTDDEKKKENGEIDGEIKKLKSERDKLSKELRVLELSLEKIRDHAGDIGLQKEYDEAREKAEEKLKVEKGEDKKLDESISRMNQENNDSFDLTDLLVLS